MNEIYTWRIIVFYFEKNNYLRLNINFLYHIIMIRYYKLGGVIMNLNELVWIPIATAVFGGLVTLVIKKITSTEYNKVRIEKILEAKQIRINKNVREYISLYFNDQRIDDLVLTEYEILNLGNKHISPFELKFEISADPNLTFVDMQAKAPEAAEVTIVKESNFVFILRRKFLSQNKKNKKEIIDVSVYSNIPTKINIIGGDKDWTTMVFSSHYSEKIKQLFIISAILLAISVATIIISSNFSNSGMYALGILILYFTIFIFIELLLIINLEFYLNRKRKAKIK